MATAIAGAVVSALGLTGTVATVASIGVQLAVAYAATSLAKPSLAGATDAQSREQQMSGGDTVERIIYGRAKVGGTVYMLQKYNGYIYYGLAICRHTVEDIEAIYFDDKLSTHPDYKNIELAQYQVDIATGESFGYETKTVTFNGTVATDADISLTTEGITKTVSATVGQTAQTVRNNLESQFHDTSWIEFSKVDDGADYNIVVERVAGGVDDYAVAAGFTDAGSGLTISISSSAGGTTAGAETTGNAVLTVDGDSYTYVFSVGDTGPEIASGLFALLSSDAVVSYSQSAPGSILITRLTGSETDFDLTVTVDTGTGTGVINQITQLAGSTLVGDHFRAIVESGEQTTANSTLVSELDFDDASMRWTANHKLTGITHINVRWDADWLKDNLGRIPAITVVLKGKNNIYDPRTNTTGYTTNAALCLHDYLLDIYNARVEQLPLADWIAAANFCDENVTISGGTHKRYAVNGVVPTNIQPVDGLKMFADAMQAPVMQRGYEYIIRPAAYRSPTVSLGENDLAGNVQLTHRPSVSAGYNVIQGVFINPDQEWQSHDYPSVSIDDGLSEKIGNLSLPLEIDPTRAQRLAKLNLVLQSNAAPVRIHIKRLPVHIPADSMINLSYPALGWSNKTFYVDSRDDQFDGTAILILLPRESSQYSWSASDAVSVDSVSSQPVFVLREDLT